MALTASRMQSLWKSFCRQDDLVEINETTVILHNQDRILSSTRREPFARLCKQSTDARRARGESKVDPQTDFLLLRRFLLALPFEVAGGFGGCDCSSSTTSVALGLGTATTGMTCRESDDMLFASDSRNTSCGFLPEAALPPSAVQSTGDVEPSEILGLIGQRRR